MFTTNSKNSIHSEIHSDHKDHNQYLVLQIKWNTECEKNYRYIQTVAIHHNLADPIKGITYVKA